MNRGTSTSNVEHRRSVLDLKKSLGAFRDTRCVLLRRYIGDKRETIVRARTKAQQYSPMHARYIISVRQGAEFLGITVFHAFSREVARVLGVDALRDRHARRTRLDVGIGSFT